MSLALKAAISSLGDTRNSGGGVRREDHHLGVACCCEKIMDPFQQLNHTEEIDLRDQFFTTRDWSKTSSKNSTIKTVPG
jgi:hypothetical protein